MAKVVKTKVENNKNVKVEKDNNVKKENNVLSFIIRAVIAIAFLALIVFIYNYFYNDNVYVDLNDPELIETEDGYKKDINFDTVVDSKKINRDKGKKDYVIICYDGDEKYEIVVGNYLYNKLLDEEKINVKGSIFYDKKGKRLSYDYEVKSLEREDDNGIIDIPDGYKEPEPERIPGVDYGDGIIW